MSYPTYTDSRRPRQRNHVAGSVENTNAVTPGRSGGEANSGNHDNASATDQLLEALAKATLLLEPAKEEQKRLQTLESENECLRTTLKSTKDGLERMAVENEKQTKEKDSLNTECQKLKAELEQTRTRLSEMMGRKLGDGNPDIADLSDANRPTKIAEKYNELYDNEWTDALEEVTAMNRTEDDAIKLLMKILLKAKEFCSRAYKQKFQDVLSTLDASRGSDITDSLRKSVSDLIKSAGDKPVLRIQEQFIADIYPSVNSSMRAIRSFIHQCVYLTWLMAVQDPPVEIEPVPEVGTRFDPNVYRQYTKTGIKIAFVVWPALRLCKDGALLCKGVAEPEKQRDAWARGSKGDGRGKADPTFSQTTSDTSRYQMEPRDTGTERPMSQNERLSIPTDAGYPGPTAINQPVSTNNIDQFRKQSVQEQKQQQPQQQLQREQRHNTEYRQGMGIDVGSTGNPDPSKQYSPAQVMSPRQEPYSQSSNLTEHPMYGHNQRPPVDTWGYTIVPTESALYSFQLHRTNPYRYPRESFEQHYGKEMYLACAFKFGLVLEHHGQTEC